MEKIKIMDLRTAKDHIDRVFGEGTADEKPELVVEYLKSQALNNIAMEISNLKTVLESKFDK